MITSASFWTLQEGDLWSWDNSWLNLSSATYQSGVLGKLPAGASSSAGLGLQVTCEVPLTVLEPRVIAQVVLILGLPVKSWNTVLDGCLVSLHRMGKSTQGHTSGSSTPPRTQKYPVNGPQMNEGLNESENILEGKATLSISPLADDDSQCCSLPASSVLGTTGRAQSFNPH